MHECSMGARQSESLKATCEQPDDSNPSARVSRSNIQRLNFISALIREGDVEPKQSHSMFLRCPQPNSNRAHDR